MAQREAVTIRFPNGLLCKAREVKKDGESLNELVVGSVTKEVRRRDALRTLEAIRQLRREIEAEHGLQPSSVPLIRAMREERSCR